MPRDPKATGFIKELDKRLGRFCANLRYFQEPYNEGRAQMFAMQHRLNTRQRNSVLKLKVASNTPDWDTRVRIIGACAEEIIADNEFGGGLPHWKMLENCAVAAGMPRRRLTEAKPIPTTRLAWNAWLGLMANCHWLEGLLANVISERTNLRGYGKGPIRRHGWLGIEHIRWKKLYPHLTEDDLRFFRIHNEADEVHSDLGWRNLGQFARRERMEERLLEAADQNLMVWELFLNGIADAGDELNRSLRKRRRAPARSRPARKLA